MFLCVFVCPDIFFLLACSGGLWYLALPSTCTAKSPLKHKISALLKKLSGFYIDAHQNWLHVQWSVCQSALSCLKPGTTKRHTGI